MNSQLYNEFNRSGSEKVSSFRSIFYFDSICMQKCGDMYPRNKRKAFTLILSSSILWRYGSHVRSTAHS